MEGGAPMLKPGSNGGDIGGDYAFAKYNKKIVRRRCENAHMHTCTAHDHSRTPILLAPQEIFEYNDAEWDTLGFGNEPGWSREETDYLFSLCKQYDLRFNVIADRYDYAQPNSALPAPDAGAAAADGAGGGTGAVVPAGGAVAEAHARGVNELKARYYTIARALITSRTDAPEEVAHKELVKHPARVQLCLALVLCDASDASLRARSTTPLRRRIGASCCPAC